MSTQRVVPRWVRVLAFAGSLCVTAWAPTAAGDVSRKSPESSTLGQSDVRGNHPVVGSWTWTRESNDCTETYHFQADGTLFVISGAELSTGEYSIDDRADDEGFYELRAKTVSNGAADCSDSPSAGERQTYEYTVYLAFHPSGQLHIVCYGRSFDRCFGPLRRAEKDNVKAT